MEMLLTYQRAEALPAAWLKDTSPWCQCTTLNKVTAVLRATYCGHMCAERVWLFSFLLRHVLCKGGKQQYEQQGLQYEDLLLRPVASCMHYAQKEARAAQKGKRRLDAWIIGSRSHQRQLGWLGNCLPNRTHICKRGIYIASLDFRRV